MEYCVWSGSGGMFLEDCGCWIVFGVGLEDHDWKIMCGMLLEDHV